MQPRLNGDPVRIGAMWFAVQMIWGAVLGVSLQARATALGGSDAVAAYSLIAALGASLAAIVQLVAGPWSDRRRADVGHRAEFYLAGAAIALPSLIAFYLVPTYPYLLLAFAGLQIGVNILSGPYQAAVPDHVATDRRGRASAWMSAYQFIGNSTGLVIAAFASNGLAAGLLALLAAAATLVTVSHLRGLPRPSTPAAALHVGPALRTLLASRAFINLGFYTLAGYLFFYVRESLGVAGAQTMTGLLFLTFTLSGVIGAALAGAPSDRFDNRVVAAIAAVFIAATVGTMALTGSLPLAFIAAGCAGVAWGAFFVADWALAYRLLPEEAMAAAMGVWNLSAAIPQIVAPLVVGPLVALLDARVMGSGPRAALGVVVLAFAIGTAWLWRLPGRARTTVA